MLAVNNIVQQMPVHAKGHGKSHVTTQWVQSTTDKVRSVVQHDSNSRFDLGDTLRNTLTGGAAGGVLGGAMMLGKFSLPIIGKVANLAGVARLAGIGSGIGLAASLAPVVMPEINERPALKAALTGASIGASAGMVVPFLTPVFGAIAGAAIGLGVHLLRKADINTSINFGRGSSHHYHDYGRPPGVPFTPDGYPVQKRGNFLTRILFGEDRYYPAGFGQGYGAGMQFGSPYGGMPFGYGAPMVSPYGIPQYGFPGASPYGTLPMSGAPQGMVPGMMPGMQPGVTQPRVVSPTTPAHAGAPKKVTKKKAAPLTPAQKKKKAALAKKKAVAAKQAAAQRAAMYGAIDPRLAAMYAQNPQMAAMYGANPQLAAMYGANPQMAAGMNPAAMQGMYGAGSLPMAYGSMASPYGVQSPMPSGQPGTGVPIGANGQPIVNIIPSSFPAGMYPGYPGLTDSDEL